MRGPLTVRGCDDHCRDPLLARLRTGYDMVPIVAHRYCARVLLVAVHKGQLRRLVPFPLPLFYQGWGLPSVFPDGMNRLDPVGSAELDGPNPLPAERSRRPTGADTESLTRWHGWNDRGFSSPTQERPCFYLKQLRIQSRAESCRLCTLLPSSPLG